MKGFDPGQAISYGWEQFKKNAGIMILAIIIIWLFGYLLSFISHKIYKQNETAAILLNYLFMIFNMGLTLGHFKVYLNIIDGKKASVWDLFSQYDLLLKYIASSFLYGIIITVGLILFIVPGIIWGIKYSLFPYFLIDLRCGPIEALQYSSKTTYGGKTDLLVLAVALMAVNILGLLACCVGLLVAVPVSMMAHVYAYRILASQTYPAPEPETMDERPEYEPESF